MGLVDSTEWAGKMEKRIDEFGAVDLLLKLTETYSNLSPVWADMLEEKEDIDLYTVGDLEDELLDLLSITPQPMKKELKLIFKNLKDIYPGRYKKDEIIFRDSEIGKEILAMMEEICDFLKNSWRKLNKIEERVLKVFPPVHFDFRFQIQNLNIDCIDYHILESLKEAISFFNEKRYLNCINSCGRGSEKLTEELMEYLEIECERSWRSNLDKLRKNFSKRNTPLIDLYWLIYYLLNVIYFLRNPHSTKAIDIPEWMDDYQTKMRENQPKWARIALICSLEAAELYQKIYEHKDTN